MNILILSMAEFPEEFPWEQFSNMYIADTGHLDDFPAEDANRLTTYVVTNNPDGVPEELLNQINDLIEDEDPANYVVSRGIPGDLGVFVWDDSDEAYRILDRLNRAGVTVLDPEDEWVEVVIDKDLSMEDVIDTITERVTADVLRIIRAELAGDTPSRRGRFRSPAPRT